LGVLELPLTISTKDIVGGAIAQGTIGFEEEIEELLAEVHVVLTQGVIYLTRFNRFQAIIF
jgi:hypothetical protein